VAIHKLSRLYAAFMREKRPFRRAACWVALCLASSLATFDAQADTGMLTVSAKVQRHTSVRMALPTTLTITANDVARGYVEVDAPVDVSVQSNVQDGYTLVFERSGEQVRAARVQGAGGPLVIEQAAMATRPATGPGMWRDALQLRFRFELDAAATAGRHRWPLNVSMMSD
jgi:hypothetical protein